MGASHWEELKFRELREGVYVLNTAFHEAMPSYEDPARIEQMVSDGFKGI